MQKKKKYARISGALVDFSKPSVLHRLDIAIQCGTLQNYRYISIPTYATYCFITVCSSYADICICMLFYLLTI